MFGDQLQAEIDSQSWPKLPIFEYLKDLGQLDPADCFQTFNMGIGLVLAVAPGQVATVQQRLQAVDQVSYQIGRLQQRPENEAKIVIK